MQTAENKQRDSFLFAEFRDFLRTHSHFRTLAFRSALVRAQVTPPGLPKRRSLREGGSLFVRFSISNRYTYGLLEVGVTHTKQSLGLISNRYTYAFSPRHLVRFRTSAYRSPLAGSSSPFLATCHSPLATVFDRVFENFSVQRKNDMRFLSNPRFLAVYSGVLTVAFAATILTGFAENERKTSFDQIDVQRINIVSPDGKNEMVIANHQVIPDAIIDGKTFPSNGRHDGAGIIFYNSEGDEDGGIGFGSKKTANGYEADGDLMFDQHKQDQTVGIEYTDENGQRRAGLHVWDRGNIDLAQEVEHFNAVKNMPAGPDKDAAMKQLQEQAKNGDFGATRLFAGKTANENATVYLCDAKSRPRLRLSVSAAGEAKIEFLDENGKVTSTLPQPDSK